MEDERIINLLWERSEQALSELSTKYGMTCMSISMNAVNNYQDAEECVNDSYLAIWKTIPPKRPNPLSAYLYKIVRNISINRYKHIHRQKRNYTYDLCLEELEYCLEGVKISNDNTSSVELAEYIDSFLATLDSQNQMLFVRRYWYMDSYESLANKTGLNIGSIKTRMTRIKNKFRKYLIERGVYVE